MHGTQHEIHIGLKHRAASISTVHLCSLIPPHPTCMQETLCIYTSTVAQSPGYSVLDHLFESEVATPCPVKRCGCCQGWFVVATPRRTLVDWTPMHTPRAGPQVCARIVLLFGVHTYILPLAGTLAGPFSIRIRVPIPYATFGGHNPDPELQRSRGPGGPGGATHSDVIHPTVL